MGDPNSVNILALLAERKIQEAMAEGQFDDLPGQGRPQVHEDLSHLPEDLRLVYRILKNGGYLEEEDGRGLSNFNDMLARSADEVRDCGRLERLKFHLDRVRRQGGRAGREESEPENDPALSPEYLAKLLDRI